MKLWHSLALVWIPCGGDFRSWHLAHGQPLAECWRWLPGSLWETGTAGNGNSFLFLMTGLIFTAGWNLYAGHKPQTTFWGVIIAVISILVMWWLIREKVKVGTLLDSDAIIADANCTKACMQLSFVLLASSLVYELFEIGSIDAIGSLFIAGIAFSGREGIIRESRRESMWNLQQSWRDR